MNLFLSCLAGGTPSQLRGDDAGVGGGVVLHGWEETAFASFTILLKTQPRFLPAFLLSFFLPISRKEKAVLRAGGSWREPL